MSIKANPRDFLFSKVKMSAPERNGFDLSHENKQTCKAGFIYPFEVLEALPGDDFQIQTESFIRLQPMLSPTMHRLKAYWHWFFVPNRLTWNYWEEFISRGNGKKLPANQEYTPPEPVTCSLYDMLYAMNYKAYDDVDYITARVTNYMSNLGQAFALFWTLSIEEQEAVLQGAFPEFIIRRVSDTSNYSRFVCIQSTPRVATSMGIVDTMIPRGVIGVDNSEDELVSVNIDTSEGNVNSFSYGIHVAAAMGVLTYYGSTQYVLPPYSDTNKILQRLHSIKLSVMPFIAYSLIYNDYYRDENLIEEKDELLNFFREKQGAVDMSNFQEVSYLRDLLQIYYRAWEKDYFTTATQMPQKAPDVLIPNVPTEISSDGNLLLRIGSAVDTSGRTLHRLLSDYAGTNAVIADSESAVAGSAQTYGRVYNSGLALNNQGQGTTVADIRRSFALQRWFEKAVRTGTRYIETLKAFFNSDAGDSRLQRPEYIGGTAMPIQISDTVQTSATADGSDTPQGNLAGYGVAADNSQTLTYHAPEHGFVFGCFSILARTSYCQGIPKMFSRETWLDYAFPEFEHIGEQGVQNKELYAAPLTKDLLQGDWQANIPDDANQFFGYQSRYAEYKQMQDRFGGAFARSLDFWSLGRIFDNAPTLSKEFVEANISDRNFAISRNSTETTDAPIKEDVQDVDTDQYICDFWLDIKKVTSLTLFSEPI